MAAFDQEAFAVGAFLAAWLDAKPDLAVVRKVAWAALGVGGLAVVGIIGFPGGHWAVVQLTAFAVFFGGALWLAVLAPPIRALRFGPLVRLGKISYGVYLYHPLIFFLVEKGLKGRLEQPVAVVAIKLLLLWAVAEASWKLIESPLLALKDRFAPSG